MQVSREQVMAFRVTAQGLAREATSVDELAVLDIGVQQAMGHPAAFAFAARLPDGSDVTPPIGPGEDLALAWTLRGAPHVHRRRDLDGLAAALVPLSEADATGRLNETGPSVARKGLPALEQYATAVRELRAAVPKPTAKGTVSTVVTRNIPEGMRRECRACGTSHISDSAMRAAFLGAGLELDPDSSPPVLLRRPKAKQPTRVDPKALAALARRYLALLGPAGIGDFADYIGARRADVAPVWPDDVETVTVEGKQLQVVPEDLDALTSAQRPDLIRLLGPFDPFLQAGDRTLLVPDKAAHKALWPVLGRPGVLLVDGEIVGLWRSKVTKTRLTLTVEPFAPLPKNVWTQVEVEAARVGDARGKDNVEVKRKA
ncbi:winged helix DNA-binding domain-containing protein [uncultured Jatrophihabitans sp.]|uniref:winged helix DNA-binding domain-containing protein n=1 Tax=uncultured Jatrophihabitans sp. TaxID=1610747 RepID=UPI0035CBA7BD